MLRLIHLAPSPSITVETRTCKLFGAQGRRAVLCLPVVREPSICELRRPRIWVARAQVTRSLASRSRWCPGKVVLEG